MPAEPLVSAGGFRGPRLCKWVALTGTLQVTVGEKTAAARAKIVIGAVKATRLYPTEIEDFRAI